MTIRINDKIISGGGTSSNESNNPYTLFDIKYSEYPLYNASWLLSNGSYYSKSVYVTTYEALEVEQNSDIEVGSAQQLPSGTNYVKRGLPVKLSTKEYTDYDFVLNKEEESFRLPIKVTQAPLSGKEVSVIGNGLSIGFEDNNNKQYGLIQHLSAVNGGYGLIGMGDNAGKQLSEDGNLDAIGHNGGAYGLSRNPKNSGLIVDLSGVERLNLYFYIGETIQNANLIDAGRIMEEISSFVPVHCVIETYVNGTSGYRIWSDRYCEQWGYTPVPNTDSTITIYFLKQYKDRNYFIFRQPRVTKYDFNIIYGIGFKVDTMTTSKIDMLCTNTTYVDGFYWYIKGYLPEGTY